MKGGGEDEEVVGGERRRVWTGKGRAGVGKSEGQRVAREAAA